MAGLIILKRNGIFLDPPQFSEEWECSKKIEGWSKNIEALLEKFSKELNIMYYEQNKLKNFLDFLKMALNCDIKYRPDCIQLRDKWMGTRLARNFDS